MQRPITLDQLSDALVDEAFDWLCTQRRHYPVHADIWHLRFHWQTERVRILDTLAGGTGTISSSLQRRVGICAKRSNS
ncbi:hypothetical protein [Pseudomonas sp. LB1P83]